MAEGKAEEALRAVMDSMPGLVALLTADGDLEFVNRQILEYTGRTLEELKRWATDDTIHPEDLPQINEVVTGSVASGRPFDILHRLRRSDGGYRWFQGKGVPHRDPDGDIVHWCVLLTDVDEWKRAEDALRESERESRLVVDTIPALVATMTPSGELAVVNQRMLEYLGMTQDEVRRWATNDIVHAEDRPRVIQIFRQVMVSGEPHQYEVRLRRFDGVYRWFQLRGHPLRDSGGRISRWYVLLLEMEELKRAEDAIRASQRNLQRIIDTIPALAWSTRSDGSADFFNLHYVNFVGLPVEQLRDWGWTAAVHPDDLSDLASTWQRVLDGGVPAEAEARLRRHDGDYRWCLFRANPLRDETGTIIKWYGVNIDIEDKKRAEEALNRAGAELAHVSRVTALSALTASITHEVNQPLSGIMTNADTCLTLLDATPPDIDAARETVRRTIRDGNRATAVITRLRALFSKREFTLEPLDLTEAAREVIALSSADLQRNRIVLKSELAEGLPVVVGDRIQLQQVILNLLRNASDAIAEIHDGLRELLIKTEWKIGEGVRLTVSDTGVGVSPENSDSLFNAFFTTKTGGMGIGLFVSRTIVDKHHGRLWAQPNRDGLGATFAFSIPCADESLTASVSP